MEKRCRDLKKIESMLVEVFNKLHYEVPITLRMPDVYEEGFVQIHNSVNIEADIDEKYKWSGNWVVYALQEIPGSFDYRTGCGDPPDVDVIYIDTVQSAREAVQLAVMTFFKRVVSDILEDYLTVEAYKHALGLEDEV